MKKLEEQDKQKIIKALQDRGATRPCPRCGNSNFTLIDGYFNQTIQTELKGMVIGGPSVPSVVVACNRCGYLSQHALGVLGLLPGEEEKK
jgi:predicted nucleic-acid-binding Zn-ribbon protein